MELPEIRESRYTLERAAHVYESVLYPLCVPRAMLDDIKNIEFFQGDIIVSSYMKSGSSWMMEIVNFLRSGLNVELAKEKELYLRSRIIEFALPPYVFEQLKWRRKGVHGSSVVKTHLLPHFFKRHLEDGSVKAIHVYRNPKDVLASYYNASKTSDMIAKTMNVNSWDDFFDRLQDDSLMYGNSVDHVLAWWQYKDNPNVLLISYEDLIKDYLTQIKRICEFLGYKYTDEEHSIVVKETTGNVAKYNQMGHFLHQNIPGGQRKCAVGYWKSRFTVEQNEFIDALVAKKLQNSNLHFLYE